MTIRTHEQTLNSALGEVLQGLGRRWAVQSEELGHIVGSAKRPDILIVTAGDWPIVIEAEIDNFPEAESDARSRLGCRLTTTARTIESAVALVYPPSLRAIRGAANIREMLATTSFSYALYTSTADGSLDRYPSSGWLSGNVIELALFLHRSHVPPWRVDALAIDLEMGITHAALDFSSVHPHGSPVGDAIAELLSQNDDFDGQTRRMAMTVVTNALVFHDALAEAGMLVPNTGRGSRPVKPPSSFRSHGSFIPTTLVDEWEKILLVNYWPIFHTAGKIVQNLPTASGSSVLNTLWSTAEKLIAGGVTKSHDLTGVVFQRLIADRKYLATFYTRPAAAALLVALAFPSKSEVSGLNWSDEKAVSRLRIGDFACGTGTLLSSAYQRLSLLYEVNGGDPSKIHPRMMGNGLVGLDVLNVAVHLTAAMLAGSFPQTPFKGECLLTMPYGRHEWGYCVGSLELLDDQTSMAVMQAAVLTAGGLGEDKITGNLERVNHNAFDLVIMNPPFTRHGAREGERTETHNPAFAAFEATEEDQNELAFRLKDLAHGGPGHGHAGLASFFVDLADRKVAPNGRVALILPLSAMSGVAWKAVRSLWRSRYSSIVVCTIAERGSHARAFSADTGMAECLITAVKRKSKIEEPRALFAILNGQPETATEGELTGDAITNAIYNGNIRNLEDGPFGGTEILLGTDCVGQLISCPLPIDGPWPIVGLSDLTLAQTAYQLTFGKLWIEGMREGDIKNIPITTISRVCKAVGSHDLDITGATIKADKLPQGPFKLIPGNKPTSAYQCLWNHDSTKERELYVLPDSHCQIRTVGGKTPAKLRERAALRWESASRIHYNRDLRFNSQSLVVATTEKISIGGRAWPTIVFESETFEFCFCAVV